MDASAIFWNPGMLGLTGERQLILGGNLLVGDVRYERERRAVYQRQDSFDFALPIEPDAIDPSRTGIADVESRANPVGLQPDIFISVPIADSGLVAAFGVYAPYAAIVSYQDDGPQRWQLQEATILATYINPALSYAITDRISFGAGGSYVFGFAELSKVLDMASLPDLGQALEGDPINQENDFGPDAPPAVRELDVLSRPIAITRAIGGGFAWNVGFGFRPTDDLRIGLSYHHSVPMTFRGDMTMDMNDEFFTQDLASQGLQYPALVEGDASISFTLPSSINVGVGYELSEVVGLDLFTRWVRWSTVDEFDVRASSPDLAQPELGLPETTGIALPRDWDDSLWLELTVRHQVSTLLGYWLSAGYHSPATPHSTADAASPDGQWAVFAAGGTIAASETISVLVDAEIQRTATRRVEHSEYDLGNGTYQMTLVNLGAHLAIGF